ncbi:uncharacterized protein LOC132704731 [Cylas formicarius]|uniref:uncharacterized protein LOC132704731 n=1 Tax=Cylas formicarius TaxID=197179 RepID=UPI0029588860|nr:uncharacterized protein LOC132704731 [Cylas formicarius]
METKISPLVNPVFTPVSISDFNNVPKYERSHYHHPSATGTGVQPYGYSSSYAHRKRGKRSIALTALTLLSFLFFLHILQTCIQEQTDMMNPQVIVMQARIREAQRRNAEAKKRIGENQPQRVFYNTSLAGEESEHYSEMYSPYTYNPESLNL